MNRTNSIMDAEILLSPENLQILEQIETPYQCYFKWFLALSEIYHPSRHCEEIASLIVSWCTIMGVEVEKDQYNNVVARIASHQLPDDCPVVAIQSHTDMVLVGELIDNKIDVKLEKSEGKRILVSPKSTLGADDGFGVALSLEMIECRDKFVHGPMEFIFTSDEEINLMGVKYLPLKDIRVQSEITPFSYKYFINCDALRGDKVFIGSSGAVHYNIKHHIDLSLRSPYSRLLSLKVSNLLGGHSGGAINMGRANAILLINRVLVSILENKIPFRFVVFEGGYVANAIPTSSYCEIVFPPEFENQVFIVVSDSFQEIINEFNNVEVNMINEYSFRDSEVSYSLSDDESRQIVHFINSFPTGVIKMHSQFVNTVEVSCSIGVININNNFFQFEALSRSISPLLMKHLNNKIQSLISLCHYDQSVITTVTGNPWTPKSETKLADKMIDAYKAENGVSLEKGLLQVTIEPSEFIRLGYDADYIAICASIPKAHCIGEWMDIDESMGWRRAILRLLPTLIE